MTNQTNVVRLTDHREAEKQTRVRGDRVNLTTKRVAALKPGKGPNGKPTRTRVADADVVGLFVIVSAGGGKSYVVRGRIGKGRSRPKIDFRIGSTEAVSLFDARQRAKAVIAQMQLGIDPRQASNDEISVKALVDIYLQRQRSRGIVRIDNQERCLDRLTFGLRETPAHLVSQAQWAEALNRIHRKFGMGAVTDARKFGRAMMQWANGEGILRNSELLLVPAPEATRAEKIASNKRKETRWTLRRMDWKRFWETTGGLSDQVFAAYLRTLALTGMRRGEASKARWEHIDLEARTWIVPAEHSKTAVSHTVFLDDLMVEVLSGIPRLCELVFPGRGDVEMSGWSQRVHQFSDHYGEDVKLHGLRRGYRTALTELRIDRDVAELNIGHARSGLDALYDHAELEELRREAQAKLEAAWMEAIR
ncbi:integrase arm-type DNA-binding domain-containing protein [Ruegeria sp. HKCCD4884]|uniref:tyrosine-type recombinase/integrase n=1 Tax=Ruegeria sp. HKCCD4884 TaxID=2683022 RepID=UPI001491B903|nr:integrase arm-type DNA-binding domain-containing protein [Ruegeria sp. HKCCD4884]NOD95384.1 integrase arm-type DNA-binding domain-containing protein [Ruegeria sp. HKCCD4884]